MSLPMSKPTSTSILGIFTSDRYHHLSTSCSFVTLSVVIGRLGLVNTTGTSNIFSSSKSSTSKLTIRQSVLLSSSIVVNDNVVLFLFKFSSFASFSEQNDVLEPLSRNAYI